MAKRNVVDFKIVNLSEEKFQELKEAGQIDPNALYCTPDETVVNFEAVNARIDTKQDIATAVNYDNITNCITEIPQDIKLELNNGTLTLKAGSKVYMPNGFETDGVTKKFDVINIVSDVVLTQGWGSSQTFCLAVNKDGSGMAIYDIARTYSGTFTSYSAGFYYEEDKNLINIYDNGVLNRQISFPIAIITGHAPTVDSIDQVFNGFGYIGSTAFALPGIKWLAPNGRNTDGTLRNNAYASTKVQAFTYPNRDQPNIIICMGTNSFYTSGQVIGSETEPSKAYTFWYKPSENILRTKAEGAYSLAQSTIPVGSFDMTTTGVSKMYTKTAFHAVDYNDLYSSTAGSLMARILGGIYPVGSVYIGTQTECPLKALIPGSSWSLVSEGRALWTGNGSNGNTTIAAGLPNITGQVDNVLFDTRNLQGNNGAFYWSSMASGGNGGGDYARPSGAFAIAAHRVSSVYGNSTTVQPPAFVVNVWRRTA